MKKKIGVFLFFFILIGFSFLTIKPYSYADLCPNNYDGNSNSCPVCPAGSHYTIQNSGQCVDNGTGYPTSSNCSVIKCQNGYVCGGAYPGTQFPTKNGCCDSGGNCTTSNTVTNTPTPTTPIRTTLPQAAQSTSPCYACPNKDVFGAGLLHPNQDNYDPRYPPSSYPEICTYNFGGKPYYYPPSPNGISCNSNEYCSNTAGCQSNNVLDPALCKKSGAGCTSNSYCNQSSECANYYCTIGNAQPADNVGFPALSGATCKYFASPPPKVDSFTPPPAAVGTDGLPCASWDKDNRCLKINTGFNIPIGTTPIDLITSIFSIVLSLSGGIAILLIIVSGYRMMISQGNPEALKEAREQLTATIVGLLFIIFSLVILQIIGYDILQIPGFKTGHGSGGSFGTPKP